MLSLQPDELHYGWAGQRCLSPTPHPYPHLSFPCAPPELWQDLSASGDQEVVAPVKGKTNRRAAKEEQTRRAGPWAANRLEVRQTHFCSDMNPDLRYSCSTSYLASPEKLRSQPARPSVRPAIPPPTALKTARPLHLFGSVIQGRFRADGESKVRQRFGDYLLAGGPDRRKPKCVHGVYD